MTPQELKNSILQLAIQGKLVEQRAEEGTGEEILKKLQPYHKALKPCKDELNFTSVDFDVPDTWVMVELNQLFDFVDYRGKTPHKIHEGVFLITASNIRYGHMDYTRKEYISQEEYEGRQSRGITRKGDLLFTTEAPMGNAALCDLEECSCGQRIITFQEYTQNTVLPKLFIYFILSPQFQQQLLDNCTGTTAKGIKADKLKHFLIPLPPLAEQKRIVAEIEKLLPYIDRYEQAWSKLEKFNKRFPVDMQKSILQAAIQGKLVEQRPEEGTGEELYKQIQAEKRRLAKEGKNKKEKPLPEIAEDEVPFDIPESWKWVRLREICDADISYGIIKLENEDSSGVKVLRCSDVKENTIVPDNIRTVSKTLSEQYSRTVLRGGEIVINVRGTLGGCAVVPISMAGYNVAREVAVIRQNQFTSAQYIVYLLITRYFQSFMFHELRGIAYKGLNMSILAQFPVPLPPLAEQKRIVAKLEELLPLCERLK